MNLKELLNKDHVIYTLYVEHEKILEVLKELDELNNTIQAISNYDENNDAFTKLVKISTTLLDAEYHHQREEKVLFIELENRNITGPTRVMCMEHDDLRGKKKDLKELALNVSNHDFETFKQELNELSKYIVFTLTNHIHKENTILYPVALRTIESVSLWDEMKTKCDAIGYCSFTPNK